MARHRRILDMERATKDHAAVREPAIGRLVSGIFEFRTLAEAEKLSALLAANYPDPDRVAVGIWELLCNAVEHGNLAIDFAEKSRLLRSGTYHAEIERRLATMPFGERVARVDFRRSRTRIRLSVELCAIYWHFLLLVWLILLGLLTGWTDNFIDICRQLIT